MNVLGLSTPKLLVLLLLYFSVRASILAILGVRLIHSRYGRKKKIYAVAYAKNQFKSELQANIKVIIFDSLFIASLLHFKMLKFAPSAVMTNLITFAGVFLWYELWFYFTHRLLHLPKLYFIHRQHHVAKVAHPLSILSFSLTERATQMIGIILFPLILQSYVPLSFEGLATYAIANLAMNWIGHVNTEFFPPNFAKCFWGKLLATPTFHALHHARQKGHYGLFLPMWDKFFGSYFSDYADIQNAAANNRPMRSLGQNFYATDKPYVPPAPLEQAPAPHH